MARENAKIVRTIIEIIDEEQSDIIDDNTVRRRLASLQISDVEHWEWFKIFNFYTYNIRIIKEQEKYVVLKLLLSELADCIKTQKEGCKSPPF